MKEIPAPGHYSVDITSLDHNKNKGVSFGIARRYYDKVYIRSDPPEPRG